MVARAIKEYEDKLYHQWAVNVHSSLPSLLKKPLLIKPELMSTTNSPFRATPISRDMSRVGSSRLEHSLVLPSSKPLLHVVHIIVFYTCTCHVHVSVFL